MKIGTILSKHINYVDVIEYDVFFEKEIYTVCDREFEVLSE